MLIARRKINMNVDAYCLFAQCTYTFIYIKCTFTV